MRIGLIDVDGHNFPNIALMKISSWHKRNGDAVEWYSPMFSGHMDVVYMSKVFSFTPDYQYYIDADIVVKGGTGYAITLKDGREVYDKRNDPDLDKEVEHMYPDYGMYGITDTAYGFTSRGCSRGCTFCHVAGKEGRRAHKVADLSEFWNGQKKIMLCDPNILACPSREDMIGQLVESGALVDINQGLDARLLTPEICELLRGMRCKCVHLAWDQMNDSEIIVENLKMLMEVTRWDRHKVMVYVLTNYDTTPEQDEYRVNVLRAIGADPYVMIYDKQHTTMADHCRKLAAWVNNKHRFRSVAWNEYAHE